MLTENVDDNVNVRNYVCKIIPGTFTKIHKQMKVSTMKF